MSARSNDILSNFSNSASPVSMETEPRSAALSS